MCDPLKNRSRPAVFLPIAGGILLFLFMVFLLWYSASGTIPAVKLSDSPDGILRLTGGGDDVLWELPSDGDWYPNRLYDPSDFDEGRVFEAPLRFRQTEDAESVPFGTYRIVLEGPPDTRFLMTGYSLDYSMKLWCGNDCVLETGTVADTAGEAVPRVGHFTVPLSTDAGGRMNLTIQYANFVHREGGTLNTFTLGSASAVAGMNHRGMLLTLMLGGGFLMFAFFFALQTAVSGRRGLLLLALCCLLFALRNQDLYLSFLVSERYNWYVHYRIIVGILMSIPFTLHLLWSAVSERARWIPLTAVSAGISAAGILAVILAPTQYTSLIGAGVSGCFIVILVVQITRFLVLTLRRRKLSRDDAMILAGILLLFLAGIYDSRFARSLPFFTRTGTTPFAMIAFVFLTKAASDLRARETENLLHEVRETNLLLQKQNLLRRDLLTNISHELRTPLAVISGYAQRTVMRLKKNGGGEEARGELIGDLDFISAEARRLGTLADRILEDQPWYSDRTDFAPVRLPECAEQIRRIAEVILEKNKNRLALSVDEKLPPIFGSREMLTQILFNLLTNANRHTKDDTLILRMERHGGNQAVVSLEDHGTGMSGEQLARAFEEGTSWDGSHGLGLPLCREIAELHGGSISLTSEENRGTTAAVILPLMENKEESS